MNYKNMWKGVDGGILTFDSIQYVLRFMIDTGVSPILYPPYRFSNRDHRFLECHGLRLLLSNTR